METQSNIDVIDTSGAGKTRDDSYNNNIKMNFQRGLLNAAKQKRERDHRNHLSFVYKNQQPDYSYKKPDFMANKTTASAKEMGVHLMTSAGFLKVLQEHGLENVYRELKEYGFSTDDIMKKWEEIIAQYPDLKEEYEHLIAA